MGSYFSDRWEALSGLPAAISANPVFFLVAFVIFAPLLWWKWRVTGKATQTAVDSLTQGLRTDAETKSVRHDTGVGTRNILVMRPAPLNGMIYFSLLFFGGGALFYIFIHMPSEASVPSDWWVALGLCAFAVAAMIVIETNQTRILVDDRTIQKRRVLHRRQTIALRYITLIEHRGKSFANGLTIHTGAGDKMTVIAGFSGYRQLIDRLAPFDAKIGLMSKLQRGRANARAARG